MLFSFEGTNLQDPVIIEKWSHLVPSRTQKLSTLSASIAICIDSESSTLPVRELSKESFSFYTNKDLAIIDRGFILNLLMLLNKIVGNVNY